MQMQSEELKNQKKTQEHTAKKGLRLLVHVRVCAPNARVTGKTYINQSREEESARESGLKREKKAHTKKNRARGRGHVGGTKSRKKISNSSSCSNRYFYKPDCPAIVCLRSSIDCMGPADKSKSAQKKKMSQTSASLGAY
jgi:hypothetical protein